MNAIELKVNAKINLSLNLMSHTSNGYHCLDSVMVSANIADTVAVSRRNDKEITVRMFGADGAAVPIENKYNSAYRAACALTGGFNLGGLDIAVQKGIPLAAGLGGSSADAAGVIAAVSKLFNIDIKSSSAYIVAFKSGSDVPFMLDGGFARVTGRGEKVESLAADTVLHMVVGKGKSGCATKAAYDKFDQLNRWRRGDSAAMVKALKDGNVAEIAKLLHNDLQTPSISVCPEIKTTLDILQKSRPAPLNCIMSGSGSACFGLYRTAAEAEAAAESIKDKLDFVQACASAPQSIIFAAP